MVVLGAAGTLFAMVLGEGLLVVLSACFLTGSFFALAMTFFATFGAGLALDAYGFVAFLGGGGSACEFNRVLECDIL